MSLLANYPLWAALASIGIAQAVKVPLHFITHRTWQWGLLFSTGGMPSSHSAAVSSLATAVGFETGLNSPTFAVATMFAGIVMYDASGVRYQAGQHAAILNQIRDDLYVFFREISRWPDKNETEEHQALKTLLGHKPSEVLSGAVTGILIAIIYYNFIG